MNEAYTDLRAAYESIGAALNEWENVECAGDATSQTIIQESIDARAHLKKAERQLE